MNYLISLVLIPAGIFWIIHISAGQTDSPAGGVADTMNDIGNGADDVKSVSFSFLRN